MRKSFTAYPLQGYWGKILGIFLSILFLILFLILFNYEIVLLSKYSNQLHYEFCYLMFMFGLFMIAFSKEKIEDERIKLIRGKSYQVGFMLLISASLANTFVEVYSIDDTKSLDFVSRLTNYINVTLALLISIGYFYYSKWRDSDSTYSDGGPIDNFKYIKSKGLLGFTKGHPFRAIKLILAIILVLLAIYWTF
jgi:hypothetical protein